MRFRLLVIKGRAAPEQLIMQAASAQSAREQAEQQGWAVVSVSAHGFSAEALWPSGALAWRRSAAGGAGLNAASERELVLFVEQLHALLSAGLSVIESLETLHKAATGRWQGVLYALIQSLRQGKPLSDALEAQAACPALLTALVRSAEFTSDLPQALQRFLVHQQQAERVRHQITSVALYPLLLTGVGASVMLFLLFYVMPRFARVFESMANLPWTATLMVAWAKLLREHGLPLGLGLAGMVALAASVFVVPAYRSVLVSRLLRIKWLAWYMRTYFLARWYRTTGMLVEGGIPLPEALNLGAPVLPAGLKEGGVQVERALRQGLSPARAYVEAHMATAVAEQLILAGERSGDVGIMLRRAAEFHEAEVTKSLDKAMRVLEPAVMTLVGVGVGIVVVLMYLPIFELASAVQ